MKVFFQLIFVTLMLLSLYFSLTPTTSTVPMIWNDKLVHCVSYFLLMMTLDFSWKSGQQLVVKSVLVLFYSSLIEYGQSFVPGREMSLADVIANGLGVLFFVALVPLLKRNNTYQRLRLI